ncbi:LuxR C-terminal-related transcriptional regulator [Pseudonocardia cypriaca]|uniref:LuxR family maltose regulon positive regulatory protein n=1 Tax=Pseudonocardia cypriaca TaxID=882449 RepID=A0A543FSP6_9PSEU|nr:LuxR C-terminal-related transcriptional regulator [Pseudonocardia cypriaca]TQM36856.1 LuxR family maltose regulon positive regulatory protein [Pseudonocardia cypriaca]
MPTRREVPLIAVKQAIPPVRPAAVPRPRLHAVLHAGLDARLTIVVAPAGWGKTTLLSQWGRDPAMPRGVTWVSLDEGDDDPVRFWTYVLTALHRDVAGLTGAPLASLLAPGLDPVDLALPALLNELSALDTEHVLVLDDYHLLGHQGIHEGMEFLLTYLPAALRVVIAGRSDPQLPLARLRARGELTELRAVDLRFTVEEGTALLTAVGDTDFDAVTTTMLCERTEGWAAGLQLAALTIRGSPHPAAAAAALQGDDRHILDYLSDEVIRDLPAEHRDLLVRTSVLERLSGALCDEVLGRDGSAAILDDLARADLFVVPLDSRGEWYRCHRLFRDALLRRLEASDPTEAARVLVRAADWFLARDYVVEAVGLRISAGDEDGAAELLCSTVPVFLERGALSAYLHLGRRLPSARVLHDPRLCVSLAWAAGLSGQFSRMGPWLEASEPLIGDDSIELDGWHTLRGAWATLRAVEVGVVGADAEAALAAATLAVELESDPAVAGYAVARTVLGAMLGFAGRTDEAIPFLEDAWSRARALDLPPLLGLQAASILAAALSETGQVHRLRRLLADVGPAVQAAEDRWGSATAPGIVRLRTAEGRLAHRDGDLGTARTKLRRAAELARPFGETPALVAALIALAGVELDDRDGAAARTALLEAREIVDTEPVLPHFVRLLEDVERRAGRSAVQVARRTGVLIEELTDREQAVLRALTSDATQREIGAALYLSINTVKGYTKVLYRKLGVVTRQDAVRRARALGLI